MGNFSHRGTEDTEEEKEERKGDQTNRKLFTSFLLSPLFSVSSVPLWLIRIRIRGE